MKNLTLRFMLLATLLVVMASPAFSQVVHEQPEGDFISYFRMDCGMAVFQGAEQYEFTNQSDEYLDIVYDAPEHCWIKNIVYSTIYLYGEYWVQGYVDLDENFNPIRIHVPLGQPIYETRHNNQGLYGITQIKAVLAWGSISFSSAFLQDVAFVQNPDATEVVYSIDGNTIHMEGSSGPVTIDAQDDVSYDDVSGLAVVWEEEGEPEEGEYSMDGDWVGIIEWGTTGINVESPTIIDEQPDGILMNYERSGYCLYLNRASATDYAIGEQPGTVQLVYDTNDSFVYFKDPLSRLQYDTWLKGNLSLDGKTISIVLPQILYKDLNTKVVTLLVWGESNNTNGFSMDIDATVREVTFAIDGNTITMQGSEGDGSTMEVSGLTAFMWDYTNDPNPNIWAQTLDFNTLLTPPEAQEQTAAPSGSYKPIEDAEGVIVTLTGTEGDIYYRITLNDEVGIWMPYYEAFVLTTPGHYTIEYYAKATDKLPSATQTLTFDIDTPTGVNETMGAKAIASVRYFNTSGQEVSKPQGLTIKVITYNDGTSQAIKVIK